MKFLSYMNNALGIIITALFTAVAWMDALEQWMRIGASGVAILAGLAVIIKHVLHILDRREKRKKK